MARIGRALRDAGGVAVRMEASGAASPWEPWLEGSDSGDVFRVHASAVLTVQDDEPTMFTCGMHHFDPPGAQIDIDDAAEAVNLARRVLCLSNRRTARACLRTIEAGR